MWDVNDMKKLIISPQIFKYHNGNIYYDEMYGLWKRKEKLAKTKIQMYDVYGEVIKYNFQGVRYAG